ncbi:GNAT family protein [Parerythrobacter jejuensis]|uniref:N-acetyltransferase n=1 Tax=Parerythrobacter jejuensis TaxID=795812 RepID=A0A845AJJ5_9SPHN|nr:GNAT family N-acetyltransferase [Parerythrobacter jejuensis]MXP30420.1 N-acetyltransferase [Parerythrobacter jejuensis]MXP33180.1 N-acetyltransferase [Parerythrobacter jejuensis]
MTDAEIVITPVSDKAGRKAFVDLGRAFAHQVPNHVPQLRSEQLELVDPDRNPFFGHATVQLFIAYRHGKPVGRISAHIDHLALEIPPEQGMGPGTGMFGYYDAEDVEVSTALLARAEQWLREKGMRKVLGPISMSVWEEPGLLVRGEDHSPMIMMGHHPEVYKEWIQASGYVKAKSLLTYDLDVRPEFPPIVQRIVKSGERNDRIRVRSVDMKNLESEIAIVLRILNDAWSKNWGFIPFTPEEVAYAGKKLKQIIHPPINRIAELDGKPVAFMLTFPDVNDVLAKIDGKLFPFGWFHMLRWLHRPMGSGMRVPLMGVVKELHNSRLASQLAFMMISEIRENAMTEYGTERAEIGWILDDNQGMVAIADAINSKVNREYWIFEKPL